MRRLRLVRAVGAIALASVALSGVMRAQDQANQPADQSHALSESIHELQVEIENLRSAVAELRSEAAEYHAENAALQQRVQALQDKLTVPSQSPAGASVNDQSSTTTAVGEQSAARITEAEGQHAATPGVQEQIDLLNGKINDLYQTKVESGSKYRVRLSGIALFNAFANRGNVDNIDFPQVGTLGTLGIPQTSLGGSLRQSLLGLEAFGPTVAGAKSSAEVQFDFAGGFPNAPNGVTFGILRLRTATLHLDWANTSIVAGQDNLFFTPLSPTSLASLAVPALSYSGNLWNWTPQLRVEHRFNLSDDSAFSVQAGVLDPLTGEFPPSEYFRVPQAGEASGVPAFGTHFAYNNKTSGGPLTIGVGGYYSREDWGFGRIVHGWAGTTDITLPLSHLFSLSAEFYRGKAIGGLGAAQSRSIVSSGNLSTPAATVRGLDDMGGWAQLKFKPGTKVEFNVAAGQDSAFNKEVLALPGQSYYGTINANRSALANFIYRPRSDLMFSAEYDRLHTASIYTYSSVNHVSLSMGVLF